MNQGNQGAEQLVTAIRKITKDPGAGTRAVDFGTINPDYSLVTDTFPVPIPRGEWSLLKYMSAGPSAGGSTAEVEEIKERLKLQPGDRVMVSWVGNEAVVTGVLTRI